MARHRPSSLRTPVWLAARVHWLLGPTARLDEAAMGVHPYCGHEYNHYHLLIDVVPRLLAFAHEPALAGIPILVNRHTYESEVVRELVRQTPALAGRLVAPPERFVKVRRLHVRNLPGLTREKFLALQSAFGMAPVEPKRRLFLTRNVARRAMINQAKVAECLAPLGFEAVDFAGMSLPRQIALARETRYLVAIHGAGIANFLFHQVGALDLLELRPDDMRYQWFFRHMAEAMDWGYDVLSGSAEAASQSFQVNPDTVAARAQEMLESSFAVPSGT
jgi:capsular polysaccharide biosynthesis protein